MFDTLKSSPKISSKADRSGAPTEVSGICYKNILATDIPNQEKARLSGLANAAISIQQLPLSME